MSKRESFFVNLFNAIWISALFTLVVPLLNGQGIVWKAFPIQLIISIIVGFVITTVLPVGKWGAMLAGKAAKPGSLLFRFIMKSVIMVIMLIFMCPVMAVLFGCLFGGAPLMAVLPTAYNVFLPLYVIGMILLMLVGDQINGLAVKCSHLGGK